MAKMAKKGAKRAKSGERRANDTKERKEDKDGKEKEHGHPMYSGPANRNNLADAFLPLHDEPEGAGGEEPAGQVFIRASERPLVGQQVINRSESET